MKLEATEYISTYLDYLYLFTRSNEEWFVTRNANERQTGRCEFLCKDFVWRNIVFGAERATFKSAMEAEQQIEWLQENVDYSKINGAEFLQWQISKNGVEYKPLKDLESDHIQEILETQRHVYEECGYAAALQSILRARGKRVPEGFSQEKHDEWATKIKEG